MKLCDLLLQLADLLVKPLYLIVSNLKLVQKLLDLLSLPQIAVAGETRLVVIFCFDEMC